MGPRSIDRGICPADMVLAQCILASMGPRSIDRGIWRVPVRPSVHGRGLQWGRDQLIAELMPAC